MALKLELPTNFGTFIDYLNTQDILISKREGKVTVSLNGYVNEEARRKNATPALSKAVSFSIGPVITGLEGREEPSFVPFVDKEIINALHKAIYKALKTHPEFKDAVDV